MFCGDGVSALAGLQGMTRGDRQPALSPVQGLAWRAVRDHRDVLAVGLQTNSETGALAGVSPGETAGCQTQ